MSAELSVESRWRFWSAEETAQKASVVGWVSSSNSDPFFGETKAAWDTLSQAGVDLGARWEPLLSQTDDLMRAWIGVLEDRQEKVAYLWAHSGRRGQSRESAVAEGLMPLVSPLRCFGRQVKNQEKWLFMPPIHPNVAPSYMAPDFEALHASLRAASEAGATERIFLSAQAAWERDALQKQVDSASAEHNADHSAPRHLPKRV